MTDLQTLSDFFNTQLAAVDSIQWAVLILGITEVLLARANRIWLYPAGIAATTLAIYSLFKAQLYAECLLHLYYIVMSIYGWAYWSAKKHAPPVVVTHTSRREWLITLTIVFGGWLVLYAVLTGFTPSTVPAWDAWISSTAWAGMWLLARRKVENWILLNVSNAFAVPLLLQKQLPLFALLTVFLFVVACLGYRDWARLVRRRHQTLQQHT